MIEKVVFNSDVVNDNDHVYFPFRKEDIFTLVRFPVYDNVPLHDTIRDAVRELHEEFLFPSLVFIPFVRYAEATSEESVDDVFGGRTLPLVCENMKLQIIVMTPDYLKDKVNIKKRNKKEKEVNL